MKHPAESCRRLAAPKRRAVETPPAARRILRLRISRRQCAASATARPESVAPTLGRPQAMSGRPPVRDNGLAAGGQVGFTDLKKVLRYAVNRLPSCVAGGRDGLESRKRWEGSARSRGHVGHTSVHPRRQATCPARPGQRSALRQPPNRGPLRLDFLYGARRCFVELVMLQGIATVRPDCTGKNRNRLFSSGSVRTAMPGR